MTDEKDNWGQRYALKYGKSVSPRFAEFINEEIAKAKQEGRDEGAEKALDELFEKTQLDIKLARQQGYEEGRNEPVVAFDKRKDFVTLNQIRQQERQRIIDWAEGQGYMEIMGKKMIDRDSIIKKLRE